MADGPPVELHECACLGEVCTDEVLIDAHEAVEWEQTLAPEHTHHARLTSTHATRSEDGPRLLGWRNTQEAPVGGRGEGVGVVSGALPRAARLPQHLTRAARLRDQPGGGRTRTCRSLSSSVYTRQEVSSREEIADDLVLELLARERVPLVPRIVKLLARARELPTQRR